MKRIDEKVREIEKKDKMNRLLFIAFVSLLSVGMAYVYLSEKRIKIKDTTIAGHESTISEQEIKLTDTYKELKILYDSLRISLSPAAYWEEVQKDNTVEGYISYLTNDWSIDKDAYLDRTIDTLLSPKVGSADFQGWLWVAYNDSDGYLSKDIVEIVYRNGANDQDLKDKEIQIGDIVRLTTEKNRLTYKSKNLKKRNELGWRNKTKGFVTETYKVPSNSEFLIKIKYY